MSTTNLEGLTRLLSGYFALMGGGPTTKKELVCRLHSINTLEDLAPIDSDRNDPLWYVVPQIIMYYFNEDSKKFKVRHVVEKSFVFVHPAFSHIVPQLQERLRGRWTVGELITRELTPRLICGLYGGYRWHAAYAAACQYHGDIGRSATILPLEPCTSTALQDLIAYKNTKRDLLAKEIVIPGKCLKQTMDGKIRAFHCPDVIENTRQLLTLGLADSSEIQNE